MVRACPTQPSENKSVTNRTLKTEAKTVDGVNFGRRRFWVNKTVAFQGKTNPGFLAKVRPRKPSMKKTKTSRTLEKKQKKTKQAGGFTEKQSRKKKDSISPFGQQMFREVGGGRGRMVRHVWTLSTQFASSSPVL